jgi:thiol-disulfide isomerase/thioredoxin
MQRHSVKVILVITAAAAMFAGASAATTQPATRPSAAERRAMAIRAREAAYLGKPMTVRGTTVDGKEFSTDSLRGKVVLVDFWASWCPDCAVELPRVVAAYKQYHDKGLEIVGISSDLTAEDLKDFLSKRTDMPWPQLHTKLNPDNRHPLNAQFGINWIPTTFLIDRNGVCRSVDASDQLETLIPELLAEAPK